MKNIHVLSTEKPSRLWTNNLKRRLELDEFPEVHYNKIGKHIYITSDEEIKYDEYYLGEDNNIYCLVTTVNHNGKKIILTTDLDLIKDGVQAIDNEFLEWFVKNPSYKYIPIVTTTVNNQSLYKTNIGFELWRKEESKQEYNNLNYGGGFTEEDIKRVSERKPKQESLEEAAANESEYLADWEDKDMYQKGFIEGAKWQQEQDKKLYSEREVESLLHKFMQSQKPDWHGYSTTKWFERFKKK